MRKKESWLGKGTVRKSHTLPMKTTTRARRLRKTVGLHDKHRSTDEHGTVSYPTPSAAQIEKAGMAT